MTTTATAPMRGRTLSHGSGKQNRIAGGSPDHSVTIGRSRRRTERNEWMTEQGVR